MPADINTILLFFSIESEKNPNGPLTLTKSFTFILLNHFVNSPTILIPKITSFSLKSTTEKGVRFLHLCYLI